MFLKDDIAATAEARAMQHVLLRRNVSPPGRLLGDSNLEWWWEPLVAKRCCSALLMHKMSDDAPERTDAEVEPVDLPTTTVILADAHVWWRRTSSYFVSVSWTRPELAFFVPIGAGVETNPYMTLPRHGGILPALKNGTLEMAKQMPVGTDGAVIREKGKVVAGVVCLPRSVVWISLKGFGPLAIENDSLTMPGRNLEFENSGAEGRLFEPFKSQKKVSTEGRWLSVDKFLIMATDGDGFVYDPAGHWNMKSVSADEVQPLHAAVWQMACGGPPEGKKLAGSLKVAQCKQGLNLFVQDTGSDRDYEITLDEHGLRMK